MKAVIFAGGLGTRLSEETALRPKPMVEIGGKPILWHIMKWYAAHGITEFVVLGGYKVEYIKQYFLEYYMNSNDFTVDLESGAVKILPRTKSAPWKVTVLDTGFETMTGGRLKRARDVIGDETFCLTYGDGVSDIDIGALIKFHKEQKVWATVTAVSPPGRFGVLHFNEAGAKIDAFREKDSADVGLINGGFFVCEPQVFGLIENDATVFEQEPMQALVAKGQLAAYKHHGFWQAMDSVRDKSVLENLWTKGKAPWWQP
jgi:glucose-1-phosphate cytidylyltransferase